MRRRTILLSLLAPAVSAAALSTRSVDGRHAAMTFPRDFGAHPQTRIEWWYATGSLQADARLYGFQLTFFRAATAVAADQPSRFAAHQLIFAHSALTDLQMRRLQHDERIARSGFGVAEAATDDTDLVLRDWTLQRSDAGGGSRYRAHIASSAAGFGFDLALQTTQPVLLQGIDGISQKGPRPQQTSHYYSQPQLAVAGTLTQRGKAARVHGVAWLDHEWSDHFLDPQAVGWDWIGMNLDDGSALTAFRLRRADASALYAGGSFRRPGEAARDFAATEVAFEPRRVWTSPASGAHYPVEWQLDTPAGRFAIAALLDDQELDSLASTGAIYWEGLSDLLDARGQRIGRGYLEMTGYAAALKLGA